MVPQGAFALPKRRGTPLKLAWRGVLFGCLDHRQAVDWGARGQHPPRSGNQRAPPSSWHLQCTGAHARVRCSDTRASAHGCRVPASKAPERCVCLCRGRTMAPRVAADRAPRPPWRVCERQGGVHTQVTPIEARSIAAAASGHNAPARRGCRGGKLLSFGLGLADLGRFADDLVVLILGDLAVGQLFLQRTAYISDGPRLRGTEDRRLLKRAPGAGTTGV